jgi:hypothetical protein
VSFRDFTFPDVLTRLALSVETAPLFADVPSATVRPEFATTLAAGVDLALGLSTEKARSEFIIAPVLLELRRLFANRFGLFSGIELSVDEDAGLNGVCDFLIARDPILQLVRGPILAVAEAKNDNVAHGFGQCIASMRAAMLFNEKAKTPMPQIYGVSTTGTEWKFLRLRGTVVTFDSANYLIGSPDRVLGVLSRIIETTTA